MSATAPPANAMERRRVPVKDDHLIYVKKKGDLYYDKDGSGTARAVKIADFKNGTKVAHDDFFVI